MLTVLALAVPTTVLGWPAAVVLDWRDAALKPGHTWRRAWLVALWTGPNRLRRRLAWLLAGARIETSRTWRDLDRWLQPAPVRLPLEARPEPADAVVYEFPTDRQEAA